MAQWYALLTKREVRMAGYWPRSFLRFYLHLDQ